MKSENESNTPDATGMKDNASLPLEGVDGLARTTRLASARRVVNLCLFAWLAASAFGILNAPIAPLFVLAVLVAALIGVARLASALDVSSLWQFILVVAMFLPVINLLAMGLLSMRATKVLRAAGFTVGIFHSGPASAA